MGKKIGKYDVSLTAATTSVQRALKKLRTIRPLVTHENQKDIDLEIRELRKAAKIIRFTCHIRRFHRSPHRKRK